MSFESHFGASADSLHWLASRSLRGSPIKRRSGEPNFRQLEPDRRMAQAYWPSPGGRLSFRIHGFAREVGFAGARSRFIV